MRTPTSEAKRRRSTRSAVEHGVDVLMESGVHQTRAYIIAELDRRPEEVTHFIADMLRDGEVEKAIERKRSASVRLVLGLKLQPKKPASGGGTWGDVGTRKSLPRCVVQLGQMRTRQR